MSELYQYDDMSALNVLGQSVKKIDVDVSPETKENIQNFVTDIQEGIYPAFSIATRTEDLPSLHMLIENWKIHFKHVVFLGVGGSSLGAQTLTSFLGPYHQKQFELYFLDNVDPTTTDDLLQRLPLEQTVVVSVSKSGSTIETMSQTLLFLEAFENKKIPISLHMIGLTEEGKNPLRVLLSGYDVPILNHPSDVGGRFTVLTLVGLIPAIAAGLNVFQLREGANDVLSKFLEKPFESAPYQAALLSAGLHQNLKPIQYLMPYSDKLKTFSHWFVQLWAESLGKDSKGTTPVPAVGSTDQHSVLQLLMQGPKDKLVTFIVPDSLESGKKISKTFAQKSGLNHLADLNLGKLIYNQAHGTAEALVEAGVPVRLIHTKTLDEKVLGALLMHFMLETALAGFILNVNTWNQPGVEASKEKTLELLTNSFN